MYLLFNSLITKALNGKYCFMQWAVVFYYRNSVYGISSITPLSTLHSPLSTLFIHRRENVSEKSRSPRKSRLWNYQRKCANALFASAILCVSSFFLKALPCEFAPSMISPARRSHILRSDLARAKLTNQRRPNV